MADEIIPKIPSLAWIDTEDFEKFDCNESGMKRLKRKVFNDPFIPIGVVATCGALSYGLFSLYKGDSIMQNYMMRTRLLCQAFTIAAVVFGTYGISYAKKQAEENLAIQNSENKASTSAK